MVETKGKLSSLVHRHLVFILAAQLSEGTNSLVDPFVTIDFLPTLDGS
jgi:hypothetical protein